MYTKLDLALLTGLLATLVGAKDASADNCPPIQMGISARATYDLSWDPLMGTVVAANASATASAFSMFQSNCHCECPYFCELFMDSEFNSDSSSDAAALAYTTLHDHLIWVGLWAYARAQTIYPSLDSNDPEMRTDVEFAYLGDCCWFTGGCWVPQGYCAEEGLCANIMPWGVGNAWATVRYPWAYVAYTPSARSDAWTANFAATATAHYPSGVLQNQIWRSAFLLYDGSLEPVAMHLISANGNAVADGLAFDEQTGEWSGTLTTCGDQGSFEHSIRRMSFSDREMDVDSNGRFNEMDASALALLDGSTDNWDLNRWDFSGDRVINTDDVDIFDDLIALGLDSGVLGDLTGDGQSDCEALNPLLYDSHLGLPDYRIEIDFDLNGITDPTDRAALVAEWGLDCDMNNTPDECEVPVATMVSSVSHKNCDLLLIPGIKSEPRQGRITEVRCSFDVPLRCQIGTPVTLEEKVCPAPGTYAPYSGASVISANVDGNQLILGFSPALENARTYRINFGDSVTSIGGQFLEVRGLVGDVTNDGQVNGADRNVVVGVWSGSGYSCQTDLNSDGTTNSGDRAIVIGAWTGTQNCSP